MNTLLHTFTEDPITLRLATTLLHSLWQGTVVALALALLLRFMRHASAGARYSLCCAALLMHVAWPVYTFFHLAPAPVPPVVLEAPWQHSTPGMPLGDQSLALQERASPEVGMHLASGSASLHRDPSGTIPWQALCVMAWMTGVVLLCAWQTMGWLALQRLRRADIFPVADEFLQLISRLRSRCGLHRAVQVHWSSRVDSPVSFGWWRSVVLLPLSLATRLSMTQMEMILAHEFAHLKRMDYVVNLLQSAVTTLLFYHPATHWIQAQICREREHACDDAAIRWQGDAVTYARTLALVAEHSVSARPHLSMAATGTSEGDLTARIQRLLRMQASGRRRSGLPGLAMLSILLLALLPAPPIPAAPELAQSGKKADAQPRRGSILDRQGVVLAADDAPVHQAVFDLREIEAVYRKKHPDTVSLPDMVEMFSEVIVSELGAQKLARDFNAQAMRIQSRSEHGRTRYVYASGLSAAEFSKWKTLEGKLPGLTTETLQRRRYPLKSNAAHVIGYVTSPNEAGLKEQITKGAAGAEQSFNNQLQIAVSQDGRSYSSGRDIHLTLDMRHQTILEQTLRKAGVGRAAAVLMEVHTGDILAMASVPSYNPNLFIPSITQQDFKKLQDDATSPLLDRSVKAYAPGAAYMVVTSLSAISAGQQDTILPCQGSITYGSKTMGCWIRSRGDTHGSQTLGDGLRNSCSVYFYQLGNHIGIDKMVATGKLLGLGTKPGISPQESEGILPGPDWLRTHYPKEKWTQGTTANTAIGQGYVLTSPLQMATVTATIANGGTVWRPRILDRVTDDQHPTRMNTQPLMRAHDLTQAGLNANTIKPLHEALVDIPQRRVRAVSSSIGIAGTTGTAQYWRKGRNDENVADNHAWFIGYAPAQKPRWAVVVLVQGAKTGGSVSAPIAREIMEQVSAVEAGTLKMEPVPLEPAEGTFTQMDTVDFPANK